MIWNLADPSLNSSITTYWYVTLDMLVNFLSFYLLSRVAVILNTVPER
jgi:hypothetical protein